MKQVFSSACAAGWRRSIVPDVSFRPRGALVHRLARLAAASVVLGLVLGAGPGIPAASSVAVTQCSEAGLRAAIADGGRVTFACDGAILLSNTLTITTNTVLDAIGHDVTLSGGNAIRVVQVNTGITLTAIGLSIMQGRGANGAGLFNDQATVELVGCTVVSNVAFGRPSVGRSGGGGMYAGGWYGGIRCGFTNVTFFANLAQAGSGGAGGLAGFGGVGDPPGTVGRTGQPGAVYGGGLDFGPGFVRMVNSILAYSSPGTDCRWYVMEDGGHNISSDASCFFAHSSSLINTDPLLGPLADHGGPTPTPELPPRASSEW